MDYLIKLSELPTVNEASYLNRDEYLKVATDFLKYASHCTDPMVKIIEKVSQWCEHLRCTEPNDPCILPDVDMFLKNSTKSSTIEFTTPASSMNERLEADGTILSYSSFNNSSSGFLFHGLQTFGFNGSNCYDDYMCDQPGMALINHHFLGLGCLILCICGFLGNLMLLPSYNIGLNRSGATVYMTAMAVFDLIFLGTTIPLYVVRYWPKNYTEQLIVYAQSSARLVPIGVPVMQICELLVVWLVVALLVNRLIYLNFGIQSKYLYSGRESIKAVLILITLGLSYMGCKFFEFTYVTDNELHVYRVVRTQLGKTELFNNLMTHWLKVPLQMFLPYLSVGALTSVMVSKMVDLHASKWKAVASLCNDTACACVCRSGFCGAECREGAASDISDGVKRNRWYTGRTNHSLPVKAQPNSNGLVDPIEQELAYIFFQLPQVDETRENANVVTAVCFGLLLLLCKIPKFLLHVFTTESYVSFDPTVFALIDHLLDTIFAVCKPVVCILVGAHFRRALFPFCHSPESDCVIGSAMVDTKPYLSNPIADNNEGDLGMELNTRFKEEENVPKEENGDAILAESMALIA